MLNELLVVNNVMVVEVCREDGSIVERYVGPSDEQLKYEHDAGKCGAMCGYCYHEACEWMATNEAAGVKTHNAVGKADGGLPPVAP